MAIHQHSLDSYIAIEDDGSKESRMLRVLHYIEHHPNCTARDIMKGLGYEDMNNVRPRVSELKKKELIVESGKVKDTVTDKSVACFIVVEK